MRNHQLRISGLLLLVALITACGGSDEDSGGPPAPHDANVLVGDGLQLAALATADASVGTPIALSGITAGDTLVGIARRPGNGMLYGLGFNSTAGTVTVYLLSPVTGQITPVGAPAAFVAADGVTAAPVQGTQFGFDFNPAADRLRVVNDVGQNFRLNPNTGAPVDGNAGAANIQMDGAINGAQTALHATAYTNNAADTTVTAQYTLNQASDAMYIQNPPNSGTQTVPVAFSREVEFVRGFDIPSGVNATASNTSATGEGFVVVRFGGQSSDSLARLDLATGALAGATSLGSYLVRGLAVSTPHAFIALNGAGNQLIRASVATPGTTVTVAVTGVTTGETLVGIDFRPQTGQLYGLGVNSTADNATLYLLDPQTGAATAVGTPAQIAFVDLAGTPIDFPAAVSGYGFDFNPTVDRVRVVTGNGINFRVNPNDGAPVDGNPAVPGTNTDGAINGLGSTGASDVAYTNSYGQPLVGGTTTVYVLDSVANGLHIMNPPNSGTVTSFLPLTLGGSPLDFTPVGGFDIADDVGVATSNTPASGSGYVVLSVGGVSSLYRIDLATGAATSLGQIGMGFAVSGLAVSHLTVE